jgi:hypothetical protein
MFAEVKFDVERPETVRAEPDIERPEPVRSVNDSPFTMRFVVEEMIDEEYIVDEEYGKLTLLAKVFVPDQ